MRKNWDDMCNSSQFVKECRILGKIPPGAYLTVFAKFICRETLAIHLLWLLVITSKNIKPQRYHVDIMNSMGAKISEKLCYRSKFCKNPELLKL